VKVVIAAKRDLIRIADYIRPHDPGRAASFVEGLLDHCQSLSELPLRHPLVPHFEHYGVHRCVHADYLIFHRVGPRFIAMSRFTHPRVVCMLSNTPNRGA
jgi:plasmid stabilization system protein ParE